MVYAQYQDSYDNNVTPTECVCACVSVTTLAIFIPHRSIFQRIFATKTHLGLVFGSEAWSPFSTHVMDIFGLPRDDGLSPMNEVWRLSWCEHHHW